jgi:hypothetical protein
MAESARLPIQTASAAAAAAITHWCALADQIAIAPNAIVITLNSAASGMARCYSPLNLVNKPWAGLRASRARALVCA